MKRSSSRRRGVLHRTALLVTALLVGSLSPLLTAGTASADGEKYVIATDTTFAPFEFQDKQGNFVGIDMDLIRAIAADQHFTVDIKPLGFDAALQAVQANQVDGVIAGMSITDKRKQVFDFSEPYFESGIQMAVLKTNEDIKSYDDLRGKRVAVKNGTQGATFANSIKDKYGFQVVSFADSSSMFDEVKTGNSVAVFEDYPVLLYGIAQGNGFKTVTPKEDPTGYGFAVNKGRNAELLQKFNAGLNNLKKSGEYDKIVNTYLGEGASNDDNSFLGLIKSTYRSCCRLEDDRHPDGRVDRHRPGARHHLRPAAGFPRDLAEGDRDDIRRHLSRHTTSGSGVLHLLRHSVGARLPDERPDRGHHHAVAERRRYMTEIVRGGIQSVDKGQMERPQPGHRLSATMRKVILPQAIRTMIPSYINQFVITLKDTSILSVIGIAELTQTGRIIIAGNYQSFKMWLIIGIIYFVVIMALTKLSDRLEHRLVK